MGQTVAGACIGVVGASRVGRAYAERVVALGADVRVYDPYLARGEAAELGVRLCELDDVLQNSTVVALHAPVTDETRGMIDARRLALVPDHYHGVDVRELEARVRLDTPNEVLYFQNGGILRRVLRELR
jgi:phosphoglycerate dehydrogenase-like enzyme